MNLIVNADDFGLCRGVNYGIVDAYRYGVVRSTTIMPGGSAFDEAVELAKANPGLGVGVHLTLTYGKPVLDSHKTLVDGEGSFYKLAWVEGNHHRMDPQELEGEYRAQIQRVLDAGIRPTHLDSHHHTHLLESFFPVFLRIAREFQLPFRVRDREQLDGESRKSMTPHRLVEHFFGDDVSLEQLTAIAGNLEAGQVVEVMSHPGYVDQDLMEQSSYNLLRCKELRVLTHPSLRDVFQQAGVRLLHYGQLEEVCRA